MKMPACSVRTLWSELCAGGSLSNRFLWGAEASVCLADLARGSGLAGHAKELRGRSVLIATRDQLTTAIALVELDGIAGRIVICPSDLPAPHVPAVLRAAKADAIVCDQDTFGSTAGLERFLCDARLVCADYDRSAPCETEWVLLTSGTTGPPKLVLHTLASLSAAISFRSSPNPVVWSTFYDIRRYGGLQIFLRAVLTGESLVLSDAGESTAAFLKRAGAYGVTHISGTPSHWRRALMSPAAHHIAPQYVRLSGEIADQEILAHLQSAYPRASVAHAFASTEAGVAFEVTDGLAGFPASLLVRHGDVEMKIEDGSLRIRSNRVAQRYLGDDAQNLADPDGFVDTRDVLEKRGDRYYFAGRRDGVINVGGLKVHPEEVEEVINRHPQVQMSLVRTRKNPVTGALVVADVVLKPAASRDERQLQRAILQFCRESLPSYKVPAAITFVPSLVLAETGKLVRQNA